MSAPIIRSVWPRRVRLAVVAAVVGLTVAGVPALTAQASTTVLPCGTTAMAGLTVAAGDVVEFPTGCSAALESSASVVVYGTLRMRPVDASVTHTLRFVGVNETAMVGGGDAVTPGDVGLWVEGAGVLDAAGTARAGWNRTGTDPSWLPGDEVLVAPTVVGDFASFPAFTPGDPVPTVTSPAGVVHPAEVMNLTRNVRIEGTPAGRAHVRIKSTVPQTIKYAALRWLGPRKDTTGDGYTDPIAGRTGLHLHRMDNASSGTLVEGLVLRDIGGGIAMDIHRSHGVTVRDSIVFGANGDGFGWENNELEPTHDTLLDRDLAANMAPVPVFRGYTQAGFILGNGIGNAVRDSAAVGVRGNNTASGFHWPSGTPLEVDPQWSATNLVAHNNKADGFYAWQNTAQADADVTEIVAYRNGKSGVDHGAYSNAYRYDGVSAFGNGVDLILHAKGNWSAARPLELVGDFGTVRIPKHSSDSTRPGIVRGSVGSLHIDESTTATKGGRTDFLDTGLQRSAVTWGVVNPSTVIRVRNGTDCWQVTAAGVATIACWG